MDGLLTSCLRRTSELRSEFRVSFRSTDFEVLLIVSFTSSVGYEVQGLEHIPAEGPVLIVFYHGALPIDFYYLFAKIWLYRNRRVRVVADNFVFKIPGRIFE